MRPTLFTRLLLGTMVAASLIGGIDAGRGGQWDLVTLFAVLCMMSSYLLLRTSSLRPLVPIRGDLVRWMTARSSVSAERTETLADRAISAYRAGLTGDTQDQHDDAKE
jgi:hypothetical protein